jgi:exosortase
MFASWRWASALAAAGTFAFLYRDVVSKLVHDWATDDNYSHGFFVLPLALYFAWRRRDELVKAPMRPSMFGLAIIGGSLVTLIAGTLGAELFLTRISLVGVAAGMVLFACGWTHLRLLAFPLAFLLLMIPLPAIVFNKIALPLQLIASSFGERALQILGVPVLREGNVIILSHTSLEVVEACSGIRSLLSLLTMGIVYGYFSDPRPAVTAVLAAATVPIAIFTNAVRVAGTGFAAQRFGPGVADGFLHTFSGWLMFVAAFAILIVLQIVISRAASLVSAPRGAMRVRWEAS